MQMAIAGCLWHLPQMWDLSPHGKEKTLLGGIRLSHPRAAFAGFASATLMDHGREASLQIPIADCFCRFPIQIEQTCHTQLSASFRHACRLHWQPPLATIASIWFLKLLAACACDAALPFTSWNSNCLPCFQLALADQIGRSHLDARLTGNQM